MPTGSRPERVGPGHAARVDHVVISVPDAAEAAERWAAAGLTAHWGGQHPAGTVNALVRGPGPAYLELIEAPAGASGRCADRVREAAGPLSWALAVDDIQSARNALLEVGFRPGTPYEGSRVTDSGQTVSWRLCDVGPTAFDPDLPFLIEWVEAMPPGPADGPVVTWIGVSPRDVVAVARMLRALGLPESPHFPGTLFGDESTGMVSVSPGSGGVTSVTIDSALPGTHRSVELDGVEVQVTPGLRSRRGWPVLRRVEEVFADLEHPEGWPDPHAATTEPREEEYSRCLDPGKYRILDVRADAWLTALRDLGLAATVELPPAAHPPARGEGWTRVTRVEPVRPGAAPFVLSRRGLRGGVGTLLAVGLGDAPVDPTEMLPDCGCDACDSGSAGLLRAFDDQVLNVIEGGVLVVRRGDRVVRRALDGWSASGSFGHDEPERWLAEAAVGRLPRGGTSVVGEPWL